MMPVGRDLPSGTVTFLFTDVEGSTKLLHELGAEAYAEALSEHRRILRAAFAANSGVEVDTQGDAFFYAFPTAPGALAAAAEAAEALASGPIRVRVGIHTGTPHVGEEGYVGVDVHRAARIGAAGHGGQVLVSSSTAALVDTDGLRDLGEHRLKDLSAPERIFQLGEADFPPLKTLYRANLPVPGTPFLGRAHELAQVVELLSGARLLTLTGPGGTGKTRLGLQAAADAAEDYPDGVFWVPLAPLRDSELVLETAAQALGAKDGLADYVADKRLLLLFDNFEHVVEAATGLSELLAACPNLRLLVTSRELLRVPGEQAYPVPPLEPQDGTELFLARARTARPGFEPDEAVAELCARLDNLPLALELAAARVRVLSPGQLLKRLGGRLDLLKAGRGVDPRQQTLRATIEWSHELLDEEAKRLFACLAVFAGGCTLDTAEAVCDADLDVLQSLVDKSLVRVRDGDRFWMLETIREYALERFEASGEADELRRRHGEHFEALGEEAWPYVREASGDWLDRLEREHDNLGATLDWLETSGESQRLLRLAGDLASLWSFRGHLVEGRGRVERALHADPLPTAARARALIGAADLAVESGDGDAARSWAEEALALHRELGDAWGTAYSVFLLGMAAVYVDWELARQRFAESAELFRELGDEYQTLEVTRRLAWAHENLGNIERARKIHEQNLRAARSAGRDVVAATTLGVLAGYALNDGRIDDALEMVRECIRVHWRCRDLYYTLIDLHRFARAYALEGKARVAARFLAAGEALHEEMGFPVEPWLAKRDNEALELVRAQLGSEALAEAWEQGRKLTLEEVVSEALADA